MNKINKIQILHNPRCKKSREALELLKSRGFDPEIIYYLKTTPDREFIREVVKKMNIPALEWVRKKETIYKTEYKDRSMSDKDWIDALAKHPELMERPVIINGEKAVIGRPTEKILEII